MLRATGDRDRRQNTTAGMINENNYDKGRPQSASTPVWWYEMITRRATWCNEQDH